jgi:hypothetical protein
MKVLPWGGAGFLAAVHEHKKAVERMSKTAAINLFNTKTPVPEKILKVFFQVAGVLFLKF